MTKETGGSAFPVDARTLGGMTERGMTLRDWFAGMALQGMLAGTMRPLAGDHGGSFAKASYGYADAMLKARGE